MKPLLPLEERLANAMQTCGQDLVAIYLEECTEELKTLENDLECEEFQRLAAKAHRSMGGSAIFKFVELSEALRDLERSALQRSASAIQKNLNECRRQVDHLNRLYQQSPPSPYKQPL